MTLTPSPLSNAAIAEYAERVAEAHGEYLSGNRVDLERLVGRLGGRIQTSLDILNHEALTVHERGNFTVHLPPLTSDRRDRFTIAHELGHYFLHYLHPGESGPKGFARGSRNRAETQANIFASSLLMPRQQFVEAVDRYGQDWWRIGDEFGVSPSAASVRAQVLGLS